MSAEPPPADSNGGYNPDDWTNANDPIDNQYLAQNYLQFPTAQGAETLGDATIGGVLTAQDLATFSDLATFNNGIEIATTAGIKFSDDSVQTVAFVEANYAQLNTDNIFLSPNQNTFAGDASTNNANAPIKLTNGVAGEYATFYLNPSTGEDITLYTNQNPSGGLTIRGANGASFTMNPASVQDGYGCSLINPLSMNGQTLSGLNNVYANTGGTITIQSPISLGTNAIAKTQTSGDSSTFVATTAFVQDAVQVSGVQTTDSPLLWQGANTIQYNGGTPSTLTYSCPYGMSNVWNITGGNGDCNIVANGGGNGAHGDAFRIYCVQNNTSNASLASMTPQLTLSNNYTAMQVRDGINIPSGTSYTINGVNILTGYATTTYVNNALAPYAPLASPALTGTPTAPTQPANSTGGAIANVDYVATAISNIAPTALPFFYASVATINWNQTTTGYFNGNYYPNTNGAYDQVQAGVATISFTVPKNPVNYPVFATATMQGNIQFPTGGTSLNSNTGPYQPFSGGSTPYGWNGTQYLYGYGCTVQPPSISGTYTITITAQTFFSSHLNSSSNISVNANPFSQVSFICYQS
jgi:hypothetical protein